MKSSEPSRNRARSVAVSASSTFSVAPGRSRENAANARGRSVSATVGLTAIDTEPVVPSRNCSISSRVRWISSTISRARIANALP